MPSPSKLKAHPSSLVITIIGGTIKETDTVEGNGSVSVLLGGEEIKRGWLGVGSQADARTKPFFKMETTGDL